MIYNHLWSPPHVAVVIAEAGRPLHVPIQVCVRCTTSRNPFTDQIVSKRGRGQCAHQDVVEQDHSAAIRRLKGTLDDLEAAGERVDRDYGQRKRAREVPALPLPYKE